MLNLDYYVNLNYLGYFALFRLFFQYFSYMWEFSNQIKSTGQLFWVTQFSLAIGPLDHF